MFMFTITSCPEITERTDLLAHQTDERDRAQSGRTPLSRSAGPKAAGVGARRLNARHRLHISSSNYRQKSCSLARQLGWLWQPDLARSRPYGDSGDIYTALTPAGLQFIERTIPGL